MSDVRRIEGDRVRLALARILESQTFARSERLRAFLKFVVEMEQLGLASQLKGYTIGVDVFSRDGSFDPGVDPLVRVQAGKLRRLINMYYADEGRNETLRIRIPLGSYVPVYETVSAVRRPADSAGAAGAARTWTKPTALAEPIHLEFDTQPAAELATSGAYGPDKDLNGLPRIQIERAGEGDWRARIFENAIRLAFEHLPGFTIAPAQSKSRGSNPHLDFHLTVDAGNTGRPLGATLMHAATGQLVFHRTRPAGTEGSRHIAGFAHQFIAETMTLNGEVYAFCRCRGLSSVLMDCLEATYLYKLENSHDAYLEASRHQQRLAHPRRLPVFITDLSDLLALTTRAF